MATILICNNDVQSALRSLKKELQKDGVFRLVKGRKNFKNNRELKKERFEEIIRRKIKDKHEAKANSAYSGVNVENPKPFVFKIQGYNIKVYNDGKVLVYDGSKKINEARLDKVDFDDLSSLIKKNNSKEEEVEAKSDVVEEAN